MDKIIWDNNKSIVVYCIHTNIAKYTPSIRNNDVWIEFFVEFALLKDIFSLDWSPQDTASSLVSAFNWIHFSDSNLDVVKVESKNNSSGIMMDITRNMFYQQTILIISLFQS